MSSATYEERRQTPRHRLGRLATMVLGDDVPSRLCLVSDLSEGGVRVNANGIRIPDEFVLHFSGSGHFKDGTYKVIWRNGSIVGAALIRGTTPEA